MLLKFTEVIGLGGWTSGLAAPGWEHFSRLRNLQGLTAIRNY